MQPQDLEFGKKAISLGFVTKEQLQLCLRWQQTWLQQGQSVSLSQCLLSGKFLTPEQIQLIEKKISNTSLELLPNEMFNNYKVIRTLGKGGAGVVYQVLDTNLQRIVALKLLQALSISEKDSKRFQLEASVTAKLNHPHIVKLFEIGDTPKLYFTMEYIEGTTLSALIKNGELNKPQKIAQIFKQLTSAVGAAHEQGIIHRDIKSANVMITLERVPKLMDFGLAKSVLEKGLSRTGDIMGTPAYMSPEQANGSKLGKSTDIYSLGATLYEALTRRPPFQGETYLEIIMQVIGVDPVTPRSLNPGIPIELEAICLKCLQKSPAHRYKNAKQLEKDLCNFLEQRPIMAKPPTVWSAFYKFLLRHKVLAISTATVLFTIVLGAFFSLIQWQVAEKQRYKAEEARNIAQKEKKINAKKAMQMAIRLAKISLAKATEAHKNKEWQSCGVLAGTALEFIKKISSATAIEKKAHALIKSSLYSYGLLWQSRTSSHQKAFYQFSYSSDGKLIATANHEEFVCVWDAVTGKRLLKLTGHLNKVYCAVFSPDGKVLASGASDSTVILWDIATGKEIKRLTGHVGSIKSLAFSPDGKKLISGCFDHFSSKDYGVRVWDVKTGKEIAKLEKHKNFISSLNFHPGGKWIVSGSFDGTAILWDLATNKSLFQFRGDTPGAVYSDFSGNGKYVATSSGKNVLLWNISNKSYKTFKGHQSRVKSLAFHPKRPWIASVSENQKILIWNHKTHKTIHELRTSVSATHLAFSPDGKKLACTSDSECHIRYWDVQSGKLQNPILGHTDKVYEISFSPDGKLIASSSHDQTSILWSVAKAKPISKKIHHSRESHSIHFHPFKPLLAISSHKDIVLYHNNSSQRLAKLVGHKANVTSVRFHPQGKWLASASADHNIILWDLATKTQIRKFTGHTAEVRKINFSPNGKVLASVSFDRTVVLWLVDSGKKILVSNKHSNSLDAITFSSDNSLLFYGSRNMQVVVREMTTGKIKATLQHPHWVTSLSISPNGKLLATACYDHSVTLWDTKTFTQIRKFTAHADVVSSVRFSPNGKLLASASFDGTIAMWHIPQKKPMRRLNKVFTHSVDFSPSGREFASAHRKQIIIWKTNTHKIIHSLKTSSLAIYLNFASQNKILAACLENNTIVFWNTIDGRKRKTLHLQNKARAVAFSPNGKYFASASHQEVILWDLATFKPIRKYTEYIGQIFSLQFSPDSNSLICPYGRLAVLWDIKSGKAIQKFSGHSLCSGPMEFTPDGKYLVSCSTKKAVLMWNVATGKLVKTISEDDMAKITSPVYIRTLTISPKGEKLAYSYLPGTIVIWDLVMGGQIAKKTIPKVAQIPSANFGSENLLVMAAQYPVIWDIGKSKPLFYKENSPKVKSLFPKIKTFSNKNSPFDFRVDISGGFIEEVLKQEPARISNFLFSMKSNETLALELLKSDPYLWR